jgi:hypothetical protein
MILPQDVVRAVSKLSDIFAKGLTKSESPRQFRLRLVEAEMGICLAVRNNSGTDRLSADIIRAIGSVGRSSAAQPS